jgi:3-oxoadipate enol-lactonase
MTESFVQARGARLFVRQDAGPAPDAPVLLLSNSLSTDMSMWDGQMKLLTQRFRVVRYDTRGHGRSEAPAGPYSFELLVEDALAVLDHVGQQRVAMMGLSLGGMTGLGIALSRPERLERLVCADAYAVTPPALVEIWDQRIAATQEGGMQAVLRPTVERWLVPEFRAANPEAVARVEAMILGTPQPGYEGCARAIQKLDYLKHLHRITVPVLYVGGSEDSSAPPAIMREMSEKTPGSRYIEIPYAAHVANIDNARDYQAAISPFLGLA